MAGFLVMDLISYNQMYMSCVTLEYLVIVWPYDITGLHDKQYPAG